MAGAPNEILQYIHDTAAEPNEWLVLELCPVAMSPVTFFHRRDMYLAFRDIHPEEDASPEWYEHYKAWLKTVPEGQKEGPGQLYTYEEALEFVKRCKRAAIQAVDDKFMIMTVSPRIDMVTLNGVFPKMFEKATRETLEQHRAAFVEHHKRIKDDPEYREAVMSGIKPPNSRPGIKGTTKPAVKKTCGSCGGGRVL